MTASALPASAAHTPSEVLQRARSDPAYAAFLVLRIGFTVIPIVFGLDKFTNVLTKWEVYLAPWIVDMSPISAHQVMLVVGVIEIVAGVAGQRVGTGAADQRVREARSMQIFYGDIGVAGCISGVLS